MADEASPSTLHHKAPEAAHKNELMEGNAARHILQWVDIMSNKGTNAVARALDRECQHA